jgi:peptide/nickel transport system permease protein
MFWVFTALFAPMIVTHDVLSQISQLKNKLPAALLPDGSHYIVRGRPSGARCVQPRGGRQPRRHLDRAAGHALRLHGRDHSGPAGRLLRRQARHGLSFIANLVLAFPVILLFYLLVTPEIAETGLPQYIAVVLFLMPLLFLILLINSRYYVKPSCATS